MNHTQVSGLKIRKKEPVQLPDTFKVYDLVSIQKIWLVGWMDRSMDKMDRCMDGMDRCMDGMDRWASFSALSSSGVAGVQGASARYSNIGFPNIHFYIGTFSNWTRTRLIQIFLANVGRILP